MSNLVVDRKRRMFAGKKWFLLAIAAVFALAPAAPAQQGEDEPLLDELRSTFQKKYLTLGALLQTTADFQFDRSQPGQNGFSIANMRLRLSGEFDQGFGYLLQTNFTKSPAILDAKMYYRLTPDMIIDGGLFKAPFSRELLTGAGNLDFVNRSRVVTVLSPARQIGVQLRGDAAEGSLNYGFGVFNGNSFAGNVNDSDELMFVARLALLPAAFSGPEPNDQLEVAINLAYSEDDNAALGGGFLPGFSGNRGLFGLDARYTRGRLLVAAEMIAARLDPDVGSRQEPFGWHITGGYMLTPTSQLLFRWDRLDGDDIQDRTDLLILGYNLWPTTPTQMRVNYVIPTDGDVANHQLLVGAQLSF